MSVNLAAVTADVLSALAAGGATPPNPAAVAMSAALANAIVNAIKSATVVPTALVAPGGGGPVTGTGNLT